MNDGWALWLVLVGLGVGIAAAWLLLVRLPRGESDVSVAERHEEAIWIAATIERYGGVAPATLVEEVLELHEAYLRDPRTAREAPGSSYPSHPDVAPLPPIRPPGPMSPPGSMSPPGPTPPPADGHGPPGAPPQRPTSYPSGRPTGR